MYGKPGSANLSGGTVEADGVAAQVLEAHRRRPSPGWSRPASHPAGDQVDATASTAQRRTGLDTVRAEMSAALAVAICGIGLACLLFAGQIVRLSLARRTRVKVEVAHEVLPQDGRPPLHTALVTAFNRGRHAVRVRSVGVDLQDGSGWLAGFGSFPGDTLPGVIQPHDSGSAHLCLAHLQEEGIDVNAPMVGRVQLASEEIVLSRPTSIAPAGFRPDTETEMES
jgi:hypothetical protein